MFEVLEDPGSATFFCIISSFILSKKNEDVDADADVDDEMVFDVDFGC